MSGPSRTKIREHGTNACYTLGPGDDAPPCRCRPCSRARVAYAAWLRRQTAYGRSRTVDADPVREHVRALGAAGLARRAIIARTGVSSMTLHSLLHGRDGRPPSRRVRRDVAERLLAVTATEADRPAAANVDAVGTRRRLRALVAIGWTQSSLADRLDMTANTLTRVIAGRQEWISVANARAVRALYDELWNRRPTPEDGLSAGGITRAIRHAAAREWPPPLAWDDDEIDDPTATPGQARPTGARRPRVDPDEVAFLRGQGLDRDEIATRLGVRPETVAQAQRRAAS